MSHLRSTNSTASQSSSSGLLGHSACEPKFSEVFTRPIPKKRSQARLTQTRAVRGCWPLTSQRAKPRRLLGSPAGIGGRARKSARSTFGPILSYSPRRSTNASRGLGSSFITITVMGALLAVSKAVFAAATLAVAAKRGCSALSAKSFSSDLLSALVSWSTGLAMSRRAASAAGSVFSERSLGSWPERFRRKRPMLWLATASCRITTTSLAPVGMVVGEMVKIALRGTRFSARFPPIAQPALLLSVFFALPLVIGVGASLAMLQPA